MKSPIKQDPHRRFPVSDAEDRELSRPSPEEARSPAAAPDTGNDNAPPANETGPRQVIEQAARDIRRGLRDTDRHGTPSDIPGPGVPPERSPGAQVPEEGVDVAGYSRRGKRKSGSSQS